MRQTEPTTSLHTSINKDTRIGTQGKHRSSLLASSLQNMRMSMRSTVSARIFRLCSQRSQFLLSRGCSAKLMSICQSEQSGLLHVFNSIRADTRGLTCKGTQGHSGSSGQLSVQLQSQCAHHVAAFGCALHCNMCAHQPIYLPADPHRAVQDMYRQHAHLSHAQKPGRLSSKVA